MKAAILSAIMSLGSNPNVDEQALVEVRTIPVEPGAIVQRTLQTPEQHRHVAPAQLTRVR